MKTIGIIPVRSGSKRFPGKNFKYFKNTTLIRNTIDKLISARIDKIYISTDDVDKAKEAAQIISENSIIDFIERPKKSNDLLSSDDAKIEDVIFSAIEYINKAPDYIIVLAQVTSSNWSPHRLVYAIHKIMSLKVDSVISVSPDLKPNGGFYVFTKDTFMRTKKIYTPNMYLVRCGWEESVDIDFEYQLHLAETISRGNYDS